MLQLVKVIAANRDQFYASEKKRGKDPSVVDEVVKFYNMTKIITTNMHALNTYKNRISKLFKGIKKDSQVFSLPEKVISDTIKLQKNDPLDYMSYYGESKEVSITAYTMEDLRVNATAVKMLRDDLSGVLKVHTNKMYELAGGIGNAIDEKVPDGEPTVVATSEPEDPYDINYDHDIVHADIMTKLGLEWGKDVSNISGNRAYILSGTVFKLKQALMAYVMDFAQDLDYRMMNVPVFMNGTAMSKVCQLSDFDETLYEVSDRSRGDREDDTTKKYLTATSEQFMVAYHENRRYGKSELPKRYCAYNECFRKETGRHGKDTSGIFRIHQFDKFEQFVVCDPNDSATELKRLLEIIQRFYDSLGLKYQVIMMDAQDINQSTSIKYDLEAWFPYSKDYKELVSCSNCTNYQAVKVNCKQGDEFVHMLNSTLCAVQRTLCCICETYWNNETNTLYIPDVLQPYMKDLEAVRV